MATPSTQKQTVPSSSRRFSRKKFGCATCHHPCVRARAKTARFDVEARGRGRRDVRFLSCFSRSFPFKKRGARGRRGARDAAYAQPRRRGVPSKGVCARNRPAGLRNHDRASEEVSFPVFECRSRATLSATRFLSQRRDQTRCHDARVEAPLEGVPTETYPHPSP